MEALQEIMMRPVLGEENLGFLLSSSFSFLLYLDAFFSLLFLSFVADRVSHLCAALRCLYKSMNY